METTVLEGLCVLQIIAAHYLMQFMIMQSLGILLVRSVSHLSVSSESVTTKASYSLVPSWNKNNPDSISSQANNEI